MSDEQREQGRDASASTDGPRTYQHPVQSYGPGQDPTLPSVAGPTQAPGQAPGQEQAGPYAPGPAQASANAQGQEQAGPYGAGPRNAPGQGPAGNPYPDTAAYPQPHGAVPYGGTPTPVAGPPRKPRVMNGIVAAAVIAG
ncbi:MAG: hypothetical protein JWR58_756, partial [Pseudonocardia sp.]|nr:hypothetical protein [Pseudonocardia sp.]